VSPGGGVYAGPQTLTLSLNEPGRIFYTTDGSDPLVSSTRGSLANGGTLSLPRSAVVKAYGVDPSGNASMVQAHTFTLITP
jgi:hypothetical protein